jgi:hypothetical protein
MTINQKGVVVQIHGNQGVQKTLFLILMLYSFVYASEVEVFSYVPEAKALVSDTEIVAGHMIRLKIRANGDKVVFPNIEEIDGAKVLEQHEIIVNRPHYINGVLKKERTILILTFAPHHDVTIPSYAVKIDGKMYKTKPIKIKVVPVNAQNTEDNNKFFLHLEADKKSVIVGEPILVTVYFSLKLGLRLSANPQYTQPVFKGFFAKQLGDEKTYNKGNRQITELKYLLTPQSEGNFTIGPARVKIGIANQYKRDMFGRVVGTTWVPIASDRVKIEVIKKPQKSDLVGYFTIESSLDTKNVKANKPVNLTVKIAGDGTLEDFEFPDFEIDGVTIYNDDAAITTDLSNKGIHSIYRKSFAFISDHDFTIPTRRISVYDIKSKTLKYLELPSYDVHVEGSQATAAQKPKVKIPGAGKVHSNLKISQKSMLDTEGENDLSEVQSPPWWMIVSAFVSGFLFMYLFKYFPSMKRKEKESTIKEDEALKILYATITESKEVEDMVRKLYAKKNGDKSIVIDETILKRLVEKYGN